MHLLQQQGLIWRRQGIGTFISQKSFLQNRLDLYVSLTELIASTGHEPGCQDLRVEVVPANDDLAQRLDVPPETPLVSVRRTRTADGRPVVAGIDYFLLELMDQGPHPMSLNGLSKRLLQEQSLQRIFSKYLQIPLDHAIARIYPVLADKRLLSDLRLPVPSGSVMLCLDQTEFDKDQRPVVTGYEYHVPGFCTCTIYRRR
jgi:GntR family transcriptional regulator